MYRPTPCSTATDVRRPSDGLARMVAQRVKPASPQSAPHAPSRDAGRLLQLAAGTRSARGEGSGWGRRPRARRRRRAHRLRPGAAHAYAYGPDRPLPAATRRPRPAVGPAATANRRRPRRRRPARRLRRPHPAARRHTRWLRAGIDVELSAHAGLDTTPPLHLPTHRELTAAEAGLVDYYSPRRVSCCAARGEPSSLHIRPRGMIRGHQVAQLPRYSCNSWK